jgi:outer membrane protein assembly factor BamE (lipoprotein component of BamABCDE complex)
MRNETRKHKEKHMRKATYIVLSLICATLMGCATATSTVGRDFDNTKVAEIKKGVTTTSELIAMFGQPFSKSVKSADEEEWTFSWAKATSKMTMGWGANNVKTIGYKKNLNVLIRGDLVINYTYDEGPFEQSTREGSK